MLHNKSKGCWENDVWCLISVLLSNSSPDCCQNILLILKANNICIWCKLHNIISTLLNFSFSSPKLLPNWWPDDFATFLEEGLNKINGGGLHYTVPGVMFLSGDTEGIHICFMQILPCSLTSAWSSSITSIPSLSVRSYPHIAFNDTAAVYWWHTTHPHLSACLMDLRHVMQSCHVQKPITW